MQADIANIGLSFLEGFALIISPCILPILPIVLAGSLTGSKKRPLAAIIVISVSFMIYLESGISIAHAETSNNSATLTLQGGLDNPYPAPAISGIDSWINSDPLQINQLRGKVVLIDFWTYSCINCMRTLPYLNAWYDKYHNDGLVIIGVHTPEFDFEKEFANVKNAVMQDGIKYPVALDNHFVTWQNFNNQYWPAHYLIDKKGNVVYTHFGEGDYDVTENNIRFLLNMKEPATTEISNNKQPTENATPETYLGYARAEHFSSPEDVLKDNATQYTFPKALAPILKKQLSPLQYEVTQEKGTEPPFNNAYWNNEEAGIYVDIVSGEPLFISLDKYDSKTGWPSFTKPLEPNNIVLKTDTSILPERTEVISKHGQSHLGHVFDDGPPPTNKRYCMNSAALEFIPVKDLKKRGYGKYLYLFKQSVKK